MSSRPALRGRNRAGQVSQGTASQGDAPVSTMTTRTTRTTRSGQKASPTVSDVLAPTTSTGKVSTTRTTRTTRSGQKATATVSNISAPTTSTDEVTKSKRSKPSTVRSRTTLSTNRAPRKRKEPGPKPPNDPVLGWKGDKDIEGNLPPIHKLYDIFTDVTKKSLMYEGTTKMIHHLKDHEIRVATMCSGTESPLLALEMIFDAIKRLSGTTLKFKHLFSAEIVPFKQAYIERNFNPPIIFRDIRELARDDENSSGSTAYGGVQDIPPDVDILVAGFSCVDFSNLNKWNKTLNETGESGDTFRAILQYAKKYRPAIIILENVMGAPWDFIQAVWENNQEALDEISKKSKTPWTNVWDAGELAYAAHYVPVDTKAYYLPQTRNRKYMICIDRQKLSSAEQQVLLWGKLMKKFKRPASSPVEAFLLDPDDPRLQRSRDELAKTGRGDPSSTRREVGWATCQGRYQDYRQNIHVGFDRPVTMWVDGGSCKPPDFWWQGWTTVQVERLWDTFEIAFLRNVRRGYDSLHKARVWELSQNVDRSTDTSPWGVVTCITPNGIPFLTTRGGPLVGFEVLALQGLPIEKLLLTRESQKELQDLAGNAMSATVVGVALLSALIVGHEAFMDTSGIDGTVATTDTPVVCEMNGQALLPFHSIKFNASESIPVDNLRQMAKSSVRLCHCEGQTLLSTSLIQECQECLHTTCQKCGGNPPHVYEVMNQAPDRTLPHEFARKIRKALPMRLCVMGLDITRLESVQAEAKALPNQDDWNIIRSGFDQCFGVELRFQSVKRTHCWTIYYEAPSSRLELTFNQEVVVWSLFAKPKANAHVNSRVRELFKYPLARMTVNGQDMLQGQWQICIPKISKISIRISGQGHLIQSWESRLGIQSPREADKRVYPSLNISMDSTDGVALDAEILGHYKLLQNCGTSSGSLHKRVASLSDGIERPMYLFLDPERTGNPKADRFVFSTDKHRTGFREVRQIVASLDPNWRPSEDQCTTTTGTVYGKWFDCGATLQPYESPEPAVFAVPAEINSVELASAISRVRSNDYHCSSQLIAFLSCQVPLMDKEIGSWQKGPWCAVDQTSERQTFLSFAWLTERVRSLGGFTNEWKLLQLPQKFERCVECAPVQPSIEWELKKAGRTMKLSPYEDGKQAGNFARAIKARPQAFATHVRVDADDCGHVMIGLNIPTLAHRALAKFEGLTSNQNMKMFWRLITQYEWQAPISLPAFKLSSNEQDEIAIHQFVGEAENNKNPPVIATLRDDQKRSLRWMIDQEADDVKPFPEQEVEEATLPELGWRAEVGVRKFRTVKGGVLADEVGYGKTATTLALIDSQNSKAVASSQITRPGSISVKATLIIVPATLIAQWCDQITKFLGNKYVVVAIRNMTSLKAMSIEKIRQADIIIAPWSMFKGDAYLNKLSRMAAIPECPSTNKSTNSRAFEAWLSMACQRLADHTEILKDTNIPEFGQMLEEKTKAAEQDEKLLRAVPTKRLRGRQYVEDAERTAAAQQTASTAVETNPIDVDANGTDGNPTDDSPPQADPMDVDTDPTDGHPTGDDPAEADPVDVDTKPDQADKKGRAKVTPYQVDPFGLKRAESLGQVKSPPLQMFHFARLVVDEYTYVKGNDYPLVASLKASNRWVLSGTPPLDDFADVKTLAGFLGIHLGIDDDAAGVLKRDNINAIRKERTTAEEFRAFNQAHSPAWHLKRQKHAQAFLNQFVRQNVPNTDHIAHHEIIRAFELTAAERAITMELQQQLPAQDMKVCRGGKARKDSDRANRLHDLMNNCETAEEALLKRCSWFTLPQLSGTTKARIGACEAYVEERRQQHGKLVDELTDALRHSTWLDKQIEGSAIPGPGDYHYRKWKGRVASTAFGDAEGSRQLLELIGVAENNYDPGHEEQFYRERQTKEEEANEKREYLEELKKQKIRKAEAKKREREDKKKAKAAARALKEAETKQRLEDAKEKGPVKRPRKPVPSIESSSFPLDIANEVCEDDSGSDTEENIEDEEEPEEIGVDEDGQLNPTKDPNEDIWVPPKDTRPFKFEDDDKAGMVQGLRFLARHLWSLSSELLVRVRGLRFFKAIRLLQVWQSGLHGEDDVLSPPRCSGCGNAAVAASEIFLLGVCGHLACRACLDIAKRHGICVAKQTEGCYATAQSTHIHCATDLGVDDNVEIKYGRKVDSIISLIKNEIPKIDQVLLFVQFDDLMEQISKALKSSGISNHALFESNSQAARKNMEDFQTNRGKSRKKVLILNSANETAAGANLTNANHIIFVSPPFANTRSAFNASLKQSIGRALRFGQQKTVYIYKFLAVKTIDVDITQERTDEKLVRVTEDEWALMPYEDLTPEEQDEKWGSGIVNDNYLQGDDLEEIAGYKFEEDMGDEDFPE